MEADIIMRHNRTIIAFLNNQSFPEQELLDHFPFPGIALTSSHDSPAQPVRTRESLWLLLLSTLT